MKSSKLVQRSKQFPENLPEELVVYHAYVLTNNFKISVPILDDTECREVRKYFTNAGIFYPWHGLQVLNYCRDKKKTEIKKKAKSLFPQMFKWGSGPNPIDYPEQLEKWGHFKSIIIVDIVESLEESRGFDDLDEETSEDKKENNMGNIVEASTQMTQSNSDITLKNYKERTGKRFRLTKNEKALVDSGQSTREQIFAIRKEQGTL